MDVLYEQHFHSDPDFPIIFHCDNIDESSNFIMHWHENIELLYFWSGSSIVTCDTIPVRAASGELVIVNSCVLHSIQSMTPSCNYLCLIVDKAFCENYDLSVGEINFSSVVRDEEVSQHFGRILREMADREPYYKTAVKAEVLALLTRLFRIAVTEKKLTENVRNSGQLAMVRKAITYIQQQYKEELPIDAICEHVGFSKYYFCRAFHEIVGKTVVEYINHLRCEYARKLLATGHYNVSECAERSGFRNLSYFTRTYKRYVGMLPSENYKKYKEE